MSTSKKSYALTIGCSYKKNARSDALQLNGTINDAKNMTNFLIKRGYDVTFMNDDLSVSSVLFPTRSNILQQIQIILSTAKSGDDLVIFYAGHGVQTLTNGQSSGIDNDVELDGKDEAIVPSDVTYPGLRNLLVDDVLNNYLRLYSKEGVNILIITDCCHSGTVCDLKYSYGFIGNADSSLTSFASTDLSYEELADTPSDRTIPIKANVITFSGCKDAEVSNEAFLRFAVNDAGEQQGVLTGAFMYIVNSNPTITSDVFSILKGVMRYTKKYSQNPKVSSNKPLHLDRTYRSILNGAATSTNVMSTTTTTTQAPKPATTIKPTTTVKPATIIKPNTTVTPTVTKSNNVSSAWYFLASQANTPSKPGYYDRSLSPYNISKFLV